VIAISGTRWAFRFGPARLQALGSFHNIVTQAVALWIASFLELLKVPSHSAKVLGVALIRFLGAGSISGESRKLPETIYLACRIFTPKDWLRLLSESY